MLNKLNELKEIVHKLETPALANDKERTCGDCGSDIGLEYYEAFDDGYNEAILDCVKEIEQFSKTSK